MTTINVYIRQDSDNRTSALTDDEIDQGMTFADDWNEGQFREFVVAVESTPPKKVVADSPDASVTIPDEEPGLVTATTA